jgi:hypothetical protein
MVPELPLARQLECELKVRSLQENGLKEPQSLLNLAISLVRQNYNLEHAVLTSLARIGHLQVELALAAEPGSLPPIDQRYFDMTKQVLDNVTPKLHD